MRKHFGHQPFTYKSLNDPIFEMIEAAIEKATAQVLNRAMEAERYAIKCEHDTRRLLVKYGQHQHDCKATYGQDWKCTCGFCDAAMKGEAK